MCRFEDCDTIGVKVGRDQCFAAIDARQNNIIS
jgi:hypothetical protein